jgi:sec-independent protein translocase protein TatA
MFGGHIWELAIVLLLALVVFGPKRLPEIGGAMGKSIKEFRKSVDQDDHSAPTQPQVTQAEIHSVPPPPAVEVQQPTSTVAPAPAASSPEPKDS